MLIVVEVLAVAFGLVNGVHDAGNAIAAPVVTRALRPGSAVTLAAVFHVVGALAVGVAVATTVAGIVDLPNERLLVVVGAALTGALIWNLVTLWWGFPCSSGHCLVGALAGAAFAEAGAGAVNWGGFDGFRPVGVIGVLVWLASRPPSRSRSPWASCGSGAAELRRASLRRQTGASRRMGDLCRARVRTRSNDAQKTMGVMALALVAGGKLPVFGVPFWVALRRPRRAHVGTALGGWRVVRTLGRRIYPITALDGLVSQGSSTLIVLAASLAGAPVSTTDVVAPSVVGVGAGSRWHHVRWTRRGGDRGLVAAHAARERPAGGRRPAGLAAPRERPCGAGSSPSRSNVVGLLVAQGRVTIEGMEASRGGRTGSPEPPRSGRSSTDADDARKAVQREVQAAFVSQISPENAFDLSQRLDEIINAAKNLVREAEVLAMAPDPPISEMAHLALEGVNALVTAIGKLGDSQGATEGADVAIKTQRRIERVYRRAMSDLLEVDDLREVMGRRELYRRCVRMGDRINAAADRIWYAVVKEG